MISLESEKAFPTQLPTTFLLLRTRILPGRRDSSVLARLTLQPGSASLLTSSHDFPLSGQVVLSHFSHRRKTQGGWQDCGAGQPSSRQLWPAHTGSGSSTLQGMAGVQQRRGKKKAAACLPVQQAWAATAALWANRGWALQRHLRSTQACERSCVGRAAEPRES